MHLVSQAQITQRKVYVRLTRVWMLSRLEQQVVGFEIAMLDLFALYRWRRCLFTFLFLWSCCGTAEEQRRWRHGTACTGQRRFPQRIWSSHQVPYAYGWRAGCVVRYQWWCHLAKTLVRLYQGRRSTSPTLAKW